MGFTTHRILHHREEEKLSYVAKAVYVLVDCGEGPAQVAGLHQQ